MCSFAPQTHIIPRIAIMHSHSSHLQRMTALYTIQVRRPLLHLWRSTLMPLDLIPSPT
jgi:hypothetical protein